MKVLSVESGKVTHLVSIRTPGGHPFAPSLMAAVAGWYAFSQAPSVPDLTANKVSFVTGNFGGKNISSLDVYSDGIIVTSVKSPTDLLDAFIDDLFKNLSKEFGIEIIDGVQNVRHYDSDIVVSFDHQIAERLSFLDGICSELSERQREYGHGDHTFSFGAVSLSVDLLSGSGRLPSAYHLARRVNEPFAAGVYFSSAPLRTDDHIALLEKLDKAIA